MKIGIIGLGRMGQAMVQRLVSQGVNDIVVWDRNQERINQISSLSIQVGRHASDVANRSDCIMVMINDDVGAVNLYQNKDGLLTGEVAGKLFIEMSTLQPKTLRYLEEQVLAKGARLLGAPMMGSIPTVLEGKLFLPLGGHTADIERAMPIFKLISRSTKHVGSIGQGHAAKLAVNLTMAAYLQALTEGLAMALAEGVSMDDLLDVLGEAPTSNGWLKSKVSVLKGGSSETTLDIVSLRKDVINAVATGALSGVPMSMAASIASSLSGAVAQGQGGRDLATFPSLFRETLIQKAA